ncbi:hypothetical protein A0U94_05310 [Gluconobacter albidus]|uniref:hypothetical protein n=1 Tax=Gluconobacter albidus TaxID=318683 RepID=UPI000989F831|nr:hypothetical protein [Gluconobacter albidus]AQS90474.1 hypothetical protein A0U94_05310 [Gluconobacter albidus]
MTDNRHAIGTWLTRLARLVRHQQTLTDFTRGEMIADYTAMLGRDGFHAAAFSTPALHDVAEACEWWPAYSRLRELLAESWKVQQVRIQNAREPLPQIVGPAGRPLAPLTPSEEVWLRYWRQGESMNWNEPDQFASTDEAREARRRIALSMVRRYAPAAAERITGRPADQTDPTDWHDVARLRRSIALTDGHPMAMAFLNCARAAVAKNAPENLQIVDDAIDKAQKRRRSEREMA